MYYHRGSHDGPVVMNQPAITGDMGSIPDQGRKTPHADMLQLLGYNKTKILTVTTKTQCKQMNK